MAPKHNPCADIIKLKQALNGNGEKGALKKVDEHEVFVQQWTGAFRLIKWIFGTSVLGLIISVIGLLIKVR